MCGGSRQDIACDGGRPAIINLPYYLKVLNWRLSSDSDGYLERNLAMLLKSVKVVALLRVCVIIDMAIVMPTRWLAGFTQDLAGYDFGVVDMGTVIDLMESAFLEVTEDGKSS